MDERQYLIDEICRLSGFSRRTVRYYVQEGLVDPPAGRGRGGYYSDVQVQQLARIRQLQAQGYRLEAIRGQLLGGSRLSAPAAPDVERGPAESRGAAPSTSAAAHSAWIRIPVAPGVELHLSAEAEQRFGPISETTVEKLRSTIENQGGPHE